MLNAVAVCSLRSETNHAVHCIQFQNQPGQTTSSVQTAKLTSVLGPNV